MWTGEYTLNAEASPKALWKLLTSTAGAPGMTGSTRSRWMAPWPSAPPSG